VDSPTHDALPHTIGRLNRPQILVVSREPAHYELLSSLLGLYNYEVFPAIDAAAAIQHAGDQTVDVLLICGVSLEEAAACCVQLRVSPAVEDVPVAFLLSQEVEAADMVEAQYYGALACMHLDAEFAIIAEVFNLVRIKFLQDELKRKMQELEHLASTDALTGLYNRRFFYRRLEEELARAARADSAISLIYVDIDFFKQVNDMHGHNAGDAVLKAVSSKVSETLRKSDVIGRVGGEEFLILLPNTECRTATLIAERLREQTSGLQVQLSETLAINVTISCGVFGTSAAAGIELDRILRLADEALYDAKHSGRNRVVVHNACLVA
jgi:diguanylate cyclase (GGDEF)-like protein